MSDAIIAEEMKSPTKKAFVSKPYTQEEIKYIVQKFMPPVTKIWNQIEKYNIKMIEGKDEDKNQHNDGK